MRRARSSSVSLAEAAAQLDVTVSEDDQRGFDRANLQRAQPIALSQTNWRGARNLDQGATLTGARMPDRSRHFDLGRWGGTRRVDCSDCGDLGGRCGCDFRKRRSNDIGRIWRQCDRGVGQNRQLRFGNLFDLIMFSDLAYWRAGFGFTSHDRNRRRRYEGPYHEILLGVKGRVWRGLSLPGASSDMRQRMHRLLLNRIGRRQAGRFRRGWCRVLCDDNRIYFKARRGWRRVLCDDNRIYFKARCEGRGGAHGACAAGNDGDAVGLAAFGFGSPTPRPEGIGRGGQQNHSDEPAEECDTTCSRVDTRQIRIIKRAQNQFLRLLAMIQGRVM
ncbi:MAG: hypothetical protein OSB70_15915, partial [Myxococcota bacterium]|nr:hypothetical protein [Myxococcota bacterium]